MNNIIVSNPVIIIGAARSGTSMVAGIVHLCGAWGGNFVQASANNPRGFFENRVIRDEMVKPFLKAMGGDRMGQRSFPDISKIRETEGFATWRSMILAHLLLQGYRGEPWFYKCTKSVHIWPLWHEAFPGARWVIVRRRDEEIISSCLRTSFMRAYQDRAGWQGWLEVHKQRFEELKEATYPNVMEIWPVKAIGGDLSQMETLIEWLGLEWRESAAREFIDRDLWHGEEV